MNVKSQGQVKSAVLTANTSPSDKMPGITICRQQLVKQGFFKLKPDEFVPTQ